MSINFSFLEFSYNSAITSTDLVNRSFQRLGFILRTVHTNGKLCMWNQKRLIILVRDTDTVTEPGLTGIGFNAETTDIPHINAQYDPETEVMLAHDPNGLRILIITEMEAFGEIDKQFTIVNNEPDNDSSVDYCSGLVYRSNSPEVQEFYEDFGFKRIRETDSSVSMVSNNRRFTIMLDKRSTEHKVNTVICETDNIFNTTAFLTGLGCRFAKFDIDHDSLDFGSLNHMIVGYNCNAFGNEESYSIENFLPNIMPGLDVIVRSRKQFIHLLEQNVDVYYDKNN